MQEASDNIVQDSLSPAVLLRQIPGVVPLLSLLLKVLAPLSSVHIEHHQPHD